MKTIVITQFFLIKLILSEVVESTVKECEVDECVSQDSCPYFAAVVDDLEELGLDTKEYNDMFAIVRENICNQEERGVCCKSFENAIGKRSIVKRGVGNFRPRCCRCQSILALKSLPTTPA